MNQKEYINIILIVLVIILAGIIGYLTLIKEPTPPTNIPVQETPLTINQTPLTNIPVQETPLRSEPVNWEGLIPAIRTSLGPIDLGVRIEASRSLRISEKKDITGDNITEALVDLGSDGAYTSLLTLMRIENDKPVVAQFKMRDGRISPLTHASGASIMNSASVVMLPDKNAIYTGSWSRGPLGDLANCSVEAYRWNPQTKNFDFNLNLSNEIRSGFCQAVQEIER